MKSILDQLDEAEKAATPGPWNYSDGCEYPLDCGPGDALLINLARNNIRALIDVARAANNFLTQFESKFIIPADANPESPPVRLREALKKLEGEK